MGGFIQGLFTIGGPFVLMGMKDKFKDKRELRSTMAGFFLLINLYRFLQNYFTGGNVIYSFHKYYWLGFFIMIAVWLGYILHLRLPEKLFYKMIVIGITTIGILILVK